MYLIYVNTLLEIAFPIDNIKSLFAKQLNIKKQLYLYRNSDIILSEGVIL